MEFYVQVSGDDIISANNGEEIHSDKLKAKLESGELTLDGIQVNKSGKVTDSISVGMDYESCSKALGDFDCIGGNGGYLSGSIESVSYTYNEKNAEIILHFFDIPSKILSDLTSSKISSVSSEEMKSYNPKLKNVVIEKKCQVGDIVSLSLGDGCSSCIDKNGNLYMWGSNLFGNCSTNNSLIPIKIMDNVREVNLGSTCSSVITNDGSLYMWGYNNKGQVGNGTTNNSSIPVKIMDNVKSVSLGSEYSGAITEDGSLYIAMYKMCNFMPYNCF